MGTLTGQQVGRRLPPGAIIPERWARSFRKAGRNHFGRVGAIISECRAPSSRNRGRDHSALPGDIARNLQAVVGETPNLAARLQALAESGAVVIASGTRRLTGGLFEYRDLGTVSLKGFAENVAAWQVLRASGIESRFEAMRTAMTPLVGRNEEIDLLLRRWEQAKAGDGQVVLISGEPGIGKSRIAETIVQRLSNEPHIRLRYFCSPHHQDSALYPSIAQLERAGGFRRDDTDDQRLNKLEAVLAQGTNDLHEAVPLFASLLSIPTGDRYPPLNLTPQKQREKTLHAQLAQVEGLAAQQPVLMAWEDVHWSDPTTRESLDLLIDRVSALRVLVIMTFRPEFAAPWIGRPHVTMLILNRLPQRQRAEMITQVTGGKVLPKEIADQIIDRTDGVPLFIEELTKAVVESGVLVDSGDCYTATGPAAPLAIPTSLHASLLARLDRLAPTREVAQIAAALGRQFSYGLISAVAPMSRQQLDDALEQLINAEIIFRRGNPPDAEYTFKHALVQDAAYSTLLRSRRQPLHNQIGVVLESRFPDIVATQPEQLAHHCAEAFLVEKAAAYWLKAGRLSIRRWAMKEAVAQLRKGLNLLSGTNSTRSREQELDLQVTLGNALISIKGYSAPEPGEAFARARELCRELNRPPKLGLLVGQCEFHLVRGELERARQHADEVRLSGETTNDILWKRGGATLSGSVCCWRGEFLEARDHYENALSSWDPAQRASAISPVDPYVSGLINLFQTLLCLGHIDQARLRRDKALAEARRLSPHTLAYTSCITFLGNYALENVRSLLGAANESVAFASEQGFPLWLAYQTIQRGWCLSVLGQTVEGVPTILRGITQLRNLGANLAMPFCLMLLAEGYGKSEQLEEGIKQLDEATKVAAITTEHWTEAEIDRVRGSLLLSMGAQVAAEESFCQALAIARRQGAKFWELRAATSLARLWRDQGKSSEAHDLLAPVYGWFTEGFDTPDLKEAQSLLEQLKA